MQDEATIRVNRATEKYGRGVLGGDFELEIEDILRGLVKYVAEENLKDLVGIKGTFCFEKCGKGPNVRIGDKIYSACSLQSVKEVLEQTLTEILPAEGAK